MRDLSQEIHLNLTKASDVFSMSQANAGLACPTGCGKCCFKVDISCAPFELLPLAYHLIDSNIALDVLDEAKIKNENSCIFLNEKDASLGLGRCSVYEYRPFICRAFGFFGRYDKNKKQELSQCKQLIKMNDQNEGDIPSIEEWKQSLVSIDPRLQADEIPIYEGIVIMLEKLMLNQSYLEGSSK